MKKCVTVEPITICRAACKVTRPGPIQTVSAYCVSESQALSIGLTPKMEGKLLRNNSQMCHRGTFYQSCFCFVVKFTAWDI